MRACTCIARLEQNRHLDDNDQHDYFGEKIEPKWSRAPTPVEIPSKPDSSEEANESATIEMPFLPSLFINDFDSTRKTPWVICSWEGNSTIMYLYFSIS